MVSFVFKAQHLSQLEQQAESGFQLVPLQSASSLPSTASQARTSRRSRELSGELRDQAQATTRTTWMSSPTARPGGVRQGTVGEPAAVRKTAAVHGSDSMPIPAQTFHGVSGPASLPASIADNLVAILGADQLPQPSVSNAKHTAVTGAQGNPMPAASSSACLRASGVPDDCNLPSDFRVAVRAPVRFYKSSPRRPGARRSGSSPSRPSTAAPRSTSWSNIAGVHRTGSLSFDQVDGGAGTPSYDAGTGETDIDIEQSGSVAPAANIIVYEAPNTDSGSIDALFTAATQNLAGSVSRKELGRGRDADRGRAGRGRRSFRLHHRLRRGLPRA